jgi:DNA topoisomerase-1
MKFNNLYKLLETRQSTANFIPLKFVKEGERADGKPYGKFVELNGGDPPEHIKRIHINPELTNVKYNPDPKGDRLTTGVDPKGRTVGIYTKDHAARSKKIKFKRIAKLAMKLDGSSVINKIYEKMKESDLDKCVALIMHTAMRVGGDADTGAEEKAYGASTLLNRHVTQKGNQVILDFIGKKHVHQQVHIYDAKIARMILDQRDKMIKTNGKDGRLFDDSVTEGRVLGYVKELFGDSFKVHDLRTFNATSMAIDLVKGMALPKNKKECKANMMIVGTKVSDKLGNTPGMALTSYIDPAVFETWKKSVGLPLD